MASIAPFLLVIAALIAETSTREHLQIEGKTYYISFPEERYNWFRAYRYCASLGMNLMDINTDVEHKRVKKLLKYFNGKYNNTGYSYWLGGTKMGSKDRFYWMSSGQYIVFNQWGPEGSTKGNCVEGNNSGERWYGLDCSINRPFICRDTLDLTDSKSICLMD